MASVRVKGVHIDHAGRETSPTLRAEVLDDDFQDLADPGRESLGARVDAAVGDRRVVVGQVLGLVQVEPDEVRRLGHGVGSRAP